jgi:hypothetical protein
MTTTANKQTQIVLTRAQTEKLAKITAHFKEVDTFTLESSSSSGIGPNVVVKFNLFDTYDTNIDITDVSSW